MAKLPDGWDGLVHIRCQRTDDQLVACVELVARARAAQAAHLAGYHAEAAQLLAAAEHFRDVHLAVERGHRTGWGLDG